MRRAPSPTLPAALAVITALAFAPALSNGFVNWDDPETLTKNWAYRGLAVEQLRWMFTTFHMGHYQPIPWITFGADYLVWGMNPSGYHATSIAFHVANALVVYAIAMRLIAAASAAGSAGGAAAAPRAAAAFAAALFALHPLRVESVAWATERRDVVSGFFCLLAALWHLDAIALAPGRARAVRRVASLAAFALALMSKAIVATLPAVLLVVDVYPLARHRGRATRLLLEKIPYVLLALAGAGAGAWAQRAAGQVPGLDEYGVVERAAIAAYGLAFYVRATLWPVALSPVYAMPPELRPFEARFVSSAILVAAITVAAFASRRRAPALLAAWIAYAISLAPVLGVVQVWGYLAADRYSYLACVGLAIAAGGGAQRVARAAADRTRGGSRFAARSAAVAAMGIVAVLTLLTSRQVRAWRDGESLWKAAVVSDPANYLAHTNLGGFYASAGRSDEAEAEFREAVRAHPRFGDALAGLGTLALDAGRLDEAERFFARALEARSLHPSAVSNIGVLRMRRNDYAGAAAAFREAIALDPAFFDAWRNLGGAYEAAGDHARAAEALAEAARLGPADADTRRLLAASLFHAGRCTAALRAARENIERDPRDLYSANVAAWILATAPEAELRDGAAAERLARAALEADADPPAFLFDTYAAALAEAGRFAEAAAMARRAIERASAAGDAEQARVSGERLARYLGGEPVRDGTPSR